MSELRLRFEPYSLRFSQTLRTARGSFRHRRGYWVTAHDPQTGQSGWGDIAPWPGFGAGLDAVELAVAGLVDTETLAAPTSVGEIEAIIDELPPVPEVRFGVELALLDWFARNREMSLAELLGGDADHVRTHVLVRQGDELLPGRVYKLKIGGEVGGAIEAVRSVTVGSSAEGRYLRVDAGGAFELDQARRLVDGLADEPIDWIEAPLPARRWSELAALREHASAAGIRIAVDESIGSIDDVEHAASCSDVVVLKPMFLGGLLRARAAKDRADELGLQSIYTHALESVVGRAGVAHLAAGSAGVHGLGGGLVGDMAVLRVSGDRVLVPGRGHGLGLGELAYPEPASSPSFAVPHPIVSASHAHLRSSAISDGERSLDYGELRAVVARRAAALERQGVRAQTWVAITGARDLTWVADVYAAGYLGAAVVPDAVADVIVAAGSGEAGEGDVGERFWPWDETRHVVATTGTTGASKLVSINTAQVVLNSAACAMRLGIGADDTWLACLPFDHVGGLSILWRAPWLGCSIEIHSDFDASRVVEAIVSKRISVISVVPTMLHRILEVLGEEPVEHGLKAVLVGGDATPEALLHRALRAGLPLATTWGMTEAASQVATSLPGRASTAAVGPALPFARVSRVGDALAIRGPLTRGTLLTSDLGEVVDGVGVRVTGRSDDVINSGGELVSLDEVERLFRGRPQVSDVIAAAIPSDEWGHRLVVGVVTDNAERVAELMKWARELPAKHRPLAIMRLEHVPTAASGKRSRKQFLALADRGLGVDPVLIEHKRARL